MTNEVAVNDSLLNPLVPRADLGPISDCWPGSRRLVTVGETSVLVHIEDDGVFAIENVCPHYQVALNTGSRRHGYVECPWHHWLINIRTGECLHNPREKVRTFTVATVDDRFVVLGSPVSLSDTPSTTPLHSSRNDRPAQRELPPS